MTKELKDANIEMFKVVYVSRNEGRQTVYGGSKVLGRPINYGYRKPGDVFNVAVDDILLNPQSFVSYPCQKPFIIKDGKVTSPCGEIKAIESVGTIEGLPGIGKKTAEKLAAMGIVTPDDVLTKVDEDILNMLVPRSRNAIREWQEQQRS